MEAWEILLISVVTPAVVTYGLPFLSERMKVRAQQRMSDVEFGARLRDELRAEIDRLREEVADLRRKEDECNRDREELHKQVGQLRHDLMQLQQRLRESGPNGNLGRAGGKSA